MFKQKGGKLTFSISEQHFQLVFQASKGTSAISEDESMGKCFWENGLQNHGS